MEVNPMSSDFLSNHNRFGCHYSLCVTKISNEVCINRYELSHVIWVEWVNNRRSPVREMGGMLKNAQIHISGRVPKCRSSLTGTAISILTQIDHVKKHEPNTEANWDRTKSLSHMLYCSTQMLYSLLFHCNRAFLSMRERFWHWVVRPLHNDR